MEKMKLSLALECPDHGLAIGMLNIDPSAKKLGYCYECIAENFHDGSLCKTLQTVSSYLKDNATFYEKCRQRLFDAGEPPVEYSEELSKKGERLEKLSKHIDQEKEKVKRSFEEVRKSALQIIDQKEKEFLQLLDKEIFTLSEAYTKLEKSLYAGWPKASDLMVIYPELDALKQRIEKIERMDQLQAFMEGVQEDYEREMVCIMEKDVLEKRKREIDPLIRTVNIPDFVFPEAKSILLGSVESMKDLMKGFSEQELRVENSVILRNKTSIYESKMILDEQFGTIKEWLPQGYRSEFKSLYRGSVDGMSCQTFHQKCDNQGATITLIKCRFAGVEDSQVLGGFIDQSWNSNKDWNISTQAFLFALSERRNPVKCPINKIKSAFCGSPEWGPKFGEDLQIEKTFQTGRLGNWAYANANLLSPSGKVENFLVEEVEVYQVQ